MSSDDGTYILLDNTIVVHARVNPFRGRLVFESARGLGPIVTDDTRCENCGQTFKLGDAVEAHLRKNQKASWRHRTACPPAGGGNQP